MEASINVQLITNGNLWMGVFGEKVRNGSINQMETKRRRLFAQN